MRASEELLLLKLMQTVNYKMLVELLDKSEEKYKLCLSKNRNITILAEHHPQRQHLPAGGNNLTLCNKTLFTFLKINFLIKKKTYRLFPFPISSYNQGKVFVLVGKYIFSNI